MDESVVHQRRLWTEACEEALRTVQEAGVVVTRPDKEPFRQAVQPMHESYRGTPIYDLIQEIAAL